MDTVFSQSTFLLCAAVFLSRILDVSFGTLRMVNVVKGNSALAMGMGFCETFVWFIFAREALQSASGLVVGAAYAGGYATGTLIGTLISKRLARGKVEVQVITGIHEPGLVEAIRAAGYGVTAVDIAATHDGEKRYLLFLTMDAKKLPDFQTLIGRLDGRAFLTVTEMKASYNGFFNVPKNVK